MGSTRAHTSQTSPSVAWLLFIAAALAVTFAVWASYAQILSFGFLGNDTLGHIFNVSQGGPDATYRLWFGILIRGATYYRPLSAASYVLDFQLGGLDARIFNLTDIAIHWANSLCVFLLGVGATRQMWSGALAGILFAVHPALAVVVANSSNRHDSLVTLGICLAVLFTRQTFRTTGRERAVSLVLALLAFALALGAKETGVIAFPLIVVFIALFGLQVSPRPQTRRAQAARIAAYSAPFAVLLGVYLILRWNATHLRPRPLPLFRSLGLALPEQFVRRITDTMQLPNDVETAFLIIVGAALLVLIVVAWQHVAWRQWLVFLLVWLAMPLAFYEVVGRMAQERFLYVFSVPFILLVSFLLGTTFKNAIVGPARFAVVGAQAALVVLALSWLYGGLLFQFPAELKREALTVRSFLEEFDHTVQTLPEGTHLELINVPPRIKFKRNMHIWVNLRWAGKKFVVGKVSEGTAARGTARLSVQPTGHPTRMILSANYLPFVE